MRKLFCLFLIALVSCNPSSSHKKDSVNTTPKQPHNRTKVVVYTTAKNTSYRITQTDTASFKPFGQPVETQSVIFIDPTHTFQTILGFGGAVTDAAANVFAKLPKPQQKEILNAYYDSISGIGYTLARTNINSCDFSAESYDYVNANDSTLQSFSVAHDQRNRIPLLKKIKNKVGKEFTLYASPWSPPAWMKDNNSMLHGGHLKPEFYQTWANYFVKFIEAYKKNGLNIWGVTVQNEPMATQTWESCIYTAQMELNFVKNYLGPTFAKKGLKDKKIIIWDHNRDMMFQRASVVLNDVKARQYVWGVGFHWYGQNDFNNVKRVQEAFPKTHLLFTEGTVVSYDFNALKQWKAGEKYARSIIHDLNNGTVGWTDWNILLNEKGGPNHVGNYCFAPIIGNTQNGQLYYMNSYYYIGHFSKFIRPGAKRISCSSNRDDLLATAFLNKDGKIAVVVFNPSDKKYTYRLWLKGNAIKTVSLPHSIQTLLVQ